MGSALHIPLAHAPAVGSTVKTTIRYKTTEGCTALQWLEKEYAIILARPRLTNSTQANPREDIPVPLQPVSAHLCAQPDAHPGHAVRQGRELPRTIRHPRFRSLVSTQTYSARVTSVLPALMSAVRASPPADGPAHGGKVVGQDVVTYVYEQVRLARQLHRVRF